MRTPITSLLATIIAAGTGMAQWQQAASANGPAPRTDAAMTISPITGEVLLFGGAPAFGSPMSDSWSWNGSSWTPLSPAANPTGRSQASMVWDQNRGVAVLYGGGSTSFFGGPSLDETWEYDGANWAQVVTVHSPGGLANFGMAYDAARGRVVVYGGTPDNSFPIAAADTWEFDGFDWTQVATANSPGALERPAMCYDGLRGRTVLFGGIDPQTGGTDVTWTFDGTNWTALTVAGSKPAARTGARMVFDQARGVCVLHGGMDFNTGAPYRDTWEFDGASWTQIGGPAIAPARTSFAMVMDDAHRRVVVFGGADANYNLRNETWEFGASYRTFGSGCAGSNGVPTLSASGAPRLGGSFAVTVHNLDSNATVAILFTGLSRTAWAFGALPADLSGFGLVGCTGYTSADLVQILGAAGGVATLTLNVPSDIGLVGLPFHHQAASIDAGANAAGIVVSNAGTGLIGR